MNINDLLVSYNQVQVPQFMQESTINYEPIEEELTNENLINQENLERIQNRKREGFAGWKPLEQLDNTQQSTNITLNMTPSKGNTTFEKAMDSYLSKHPEDAQYRQTLTKIAEKESNFNSKIKNKASSASGYFQFIDSTRKAYAPNLTREQFLDSPEEQISAAVKLLKANRKISNKYSNLRGLSQLQIDYGMWFSPKALSNYLKTGKSDFKDPQGTSLMTVLKKMA